MIKYIFENFDLKIGLLMIISQHAIGRNKLILCFIYISFTYQLNLYKLNLFIQRGKMLS